MCGRTAIFPPEKDNLSPRQSPAFRPMLSAPPASAGESSLRLGVMKARGYDWWIDRLRWATRPATTFASITSVDSSSSGDSALSQRGERPLVDGRRMNCSTSFVSPRGYLLRRRSGHITPEVHALRERHQFGMRCCNSALRNRAHVYLRTASCRTRVYTAPTIMNHSAVDVWVSETSVRLFELCRGRRRRCSLAFIRLAQASWQPVRVLCKIARLAAKPLNTLASPKETSAGVPADH